MHCAKCKTAFEITAWDESFYAKIKVPKPTLCPECRNQRRMSFRNERHLYHRNCDLCTKNFLSIYDKGVAFPVYCYDCFWSDKWDALEFGRDYDETRGFFDQIGELFGRVPHLGIVTAFCENCDFANYTNYSKNCYLIFGCHAAQDCYYGWRVHDSLHCVDCLQIDKCKYCYDCVDCDESYNLFFSQDCSGCSDSAFLYDCKSCRDCMFCAGLKSKQYCIFNRQHTKEEYESEKRQFNLGSHAGLLAARERFLKGVRSYPRRATFMLNCENVSGDHVINSKNAYMAFHCKNVHDGAYLESCEDLKDSVDCTFCGWPGELVYEGISAGCVNSYDVKFCDTCWSVNGLEYCSYCFNSKELFGCCSLRRKNEYCILNKQYSAEDYALLKKKIIENMVVRKEYGEFFPAQLSPFAYDETVASDYYPLGSAVAPLLDYKAQNFEIPDDIANVNGEILKEVLACEECGKNYKIVQPELSFYKKFTLPVPRKCFNCRHKSRMNQRSLRQLWERECFKCGEAVQATYSTESGIEVYCEKCYLKTIY